MKMAIVHQFPFMSSLQRMSVICQQADCSNLLIYSKGAPETIAKHCLPTTGKNVTGFQNITFITY